MESPTRIIDTDEYNKLCHLELAMEGMLRTLTLDALSFNPPTEEDDNPTGVKGDHLHVQVLNVGEPVLYIKKSGSQRVPIVILPKYAEYGYDDFSILHSNKKPWGFVLAPHGWNPADPSDDLEDAMWFFPGENKETIWL